MGEVWGLGKVWEGGILSWRGSIARVGGRVSRGLMQP